MRVPFFLSLLSMSVRSSMALRAAFLLQVALMAINNVCFFATWWILFQRYDQIHGWRLPDMAALYGVSAAGFGIAVVACGGIYELGRMVHEGELDSLLAQPKSVLLRAIASRSRASGWGDLVSGLFFLGISGYLRGYGVLVALLSVSLSAITYVACGVVFQSAAFWLGRIETLARQLLDFTIAFSLYPPSLFGAGLRVLLFTLLPAALVSYLPVELVREFHPGRAALAVVLVAAYALFALWLFGRGLRRYESGSRFGVWG